jgi:hypothetical protein
VPKPPADEEAVQAFVRKGFEQSLENYQRVLPPDALRKVADPRVLALYVAAPEIIAELKAVGEESWRYVEEAARACAEDRKAIASRSTSRMIYSSCATPRMKRAAYWQAR